MDRSILDLPVIGGRGYRSARLSGQQCFELWVHRGTVERVAQVLKDEFDIISHTGRAYTDVAVGLAAKKYILFNQKDARKFWEAKYGEITDDIWYDYLVRNYHLLGLYSSNTIAQWKAANPEILAHKKSLEQDTLR